MNKRIRQYVGIIAAIVTYYIVHEGAHLICACIFGVYKHVYFKGIGVQVNVYRGKMTDTELGVFLSGRSRINRNGKSETVNKGNLKIRDYLN